MFGFAAAAEEKALITINGKTVMADSSANDVTALFGQPKLVTPSAFGGSAYTYYGDDYADYLYIETASDERIVSYCSFAPGFRCFLCRSSCPPPRNTKRC